MIHDSDMAPLGCLIKIPIRKDNARTLSTVFQHDVLQVANSSPYDRMASIGAAGKRNLLTSM